MLTYEQFKERLATCGYQYGDDAAQCAYLGYTLATSDGLSRSQSQNLTGEVMSTSQEHDDQWDEGHLAYAATIEPQWVVNDLGELGVKVGSRFFFLYKGDNIEYGSYAKDGLALHDDGTPMKYRIVGKREFGETCWPLLWVKTGHREDRYTVNLQYIDGLSFGKPEDGDWKPLPANGD